MEGINSEHIFLFMNEPQCYNITNLSDDNYQQDVLVYPQFIYHYIIVAMAVHLQGGMHIYSDAICFESMKTNGE